MEGDARAGGDMNNGNGEKTAAAAAPPLSAYQINQLLHDVAKDVYARADALAKQVDELEGDFEAPAALRARLAELSRMEDELSVEFETRLMELDAMVKRRLATLRAGEEDDAAAAGAASGVVEVYSFSAHEADVFDEDRSDDQDFAVVGELGSSVM